MKYIYFVSFIYLVLVAFPNSTYAATLYFDPAITTIHRGDAITIAIRLDTDESVNECINAADIVIEYSQGLLPIDTSIGRSIFSMWVEKPTINKENRTITLAGGIPNGYCGRVQGDPRLTNIIAEIVFRSPGLQIGGTSNDNEVTIEFTEETSLYLNDGFGTKAPLRAMPAQIELLTTIGNEIKDEWRDRIQADTISPEPFAIELMHGQTAYGEKHYIVFTTSDKQSGISHYEVYEEPLEDARWFSFGAVTAPWQRVEGPVYILSDQSLRSIIRVKAVDKAGNEYIASLQPQNQNQYINTWLLVGIWGSSVLILSLVLLIFIQNRRRRRKNNDTVELYENQ